MLLQSAPHALFSHANNAPPPPARRGRGSQQAQKTPRRGRVRRHRSSKGSLNKLRAGSVAVQKRFLCAQCPAKYLQRALKDVRRHFGQHLLFDDAEERVQAFRAFGSWLGDVHELAFVPAMDLPETYKYETIHVLQALLKSLDAVSYTHLTLPTILLV